MRRFIMFTKKYVQGAAVVPPTYTPRKYLQHNGKTLIAMVISTS